jgi:hypothetical protein
VFIALTLIQDKHPPPPNPESIQKHLGVNTTNIIIIIIIIIPTENATFVYNMEISYSTEITFIRHKSKNNDVSVYSIILPHCSNSRIRLFLSCGATAQIWPRPPPFGGF